MTDDGPVSCVLRRLTGALSSVGRSIRTAGRTATSAIYAALTDEDGIKPGVKQLAISVVAVAVLIVIGVRVRPWRYLNVERVIYLFVFAVSALLIPGFIALNGPAIPNRLRGPLGKLNFVLGQLTYGVGLLVQRASRDYEMCMGRKRDGGLEVYLDGEWKPVDGGVEHLSRLGMRKFGVIAEKDSGDLKPYRVDPESVTAADGGLKPERGGYEEIVPRDVDDGAWLLDATRLAPSKEAGGSGVIQRAEEQEMKNQAKGSRLGTWSDVIGAVLGLVVGCIMAYLIFGPGI